MKSKSFPHLHLLVAALLIVLLAGKVGAQGGGASRGGAANTVEGTGRGAGGPGDGEGPGQGAGQGLGPGGRDKNKTNEPDPNDGRDSEKERAEREKAEKEKADKERAEREKAEKEKADRGREEKERREREEREREEKEKVQREKDDREKSEKERAEKEKSSEEEPGNKGEKPDSPTGSTDESKPDQPATDDEPRRGGEDRDDTPESPGSREEKSETPEPDSEISRTDTPAQRDVVPDLPRRDLVPGTENIPGVDDAQRTLRGLTDPTKARDGVLGFLFGPRKTVPGTVAASPALTGKEVLRAERAARVQRSRGAFLGIFRLEVPDLVSAAKVSRVQIDPRVSSPRTLTYKSRISRVSRWIGPFTLGLLNYVPFETMNAAVTGRMNNLMAEEKIAVEEMAARVFAESLASGRRFVVGSPAEATVEVELTRYALDPVPTSLGRMKPTVSLTGRLYSPEGRLLWIGKGFSTIAESGMKGATVEQYEDNPALLRRDFEDTIRIAASRLAAQANALPRAKVTVVPAR